jgi:vitamin K-dependent gamma-carboxylase-like protein
MSPRRHIIWEWWDRFWFAPGSARNLAAARIVIAVHALWIVLSRDYAGISRLPADFWSGVTTLDRVRYAIVPGHPMVERALTVIAVVALLAVALGLATRVSCIVAALLLYHLAPFETILWTTSPYERGLEISTLSLVVLAIAPCPDVWSVTARRRAAQEAAWEYHWPLVLLQLFVAQAYLFSGWSKLFRVGWSWVSAENLRHWLLLFTQEDQIAVFRGLGTWFAGHPALCLLIAIGSLTLDLTFIVVLVWKQARKVYVPLAAAFHVGIFFTMNIAFLNLPQLLVFLDWDWLTNRVHGNRAAPRPEPSAVTP